MRSASSPAYQFLGAQTVFFCICKAVAGVCLILTNELRGINENKVSSANVAVVLIAPVKPYIFERGPIVFLLWSVQFWDPILKIMRMSLRIGPLVHHIIEPKANIDRIILRHLLNYC